MKKVADAAQIVPAGGQQQEERGGEAGLGPGVPLQAIRVPPEYEAALDNQLMTPEQVTRQQQQQQEHKQQAHRTQQKHDDDDW